MSAPVSPSSRREPPAPGPSEPAFAAEPTDAGQQALVPGVAPLGPAKPQQRCDFALFDLAARAQLDLVIHAGN
jgi:hypothetical protein